jgi:hypothetical protein
MTRPDQESVRYVGQGGVLGAQPPVAPATPEPAAPVPEQPPAPPQHAYPPVAQPAPPLAAPGGLVSGAYQSTGQVATTGTAIATGAAISAAGTTTVAAATAGATGPGNRPPEQGTVYGSGQPSDADGRRPLSGQLARLRIGWHTVSRSALAQLGVSSPGTGMILGIDVEQRPVTVRFFRPEPTRVTLVGGVWAAQLVAFRALALGANLIVLTVDPRAWHEFGDRAGVRRDRVTVIPGEQPVHTAGSAQQPALVIHDLGTVGPSAPVAPSSWLTQMTVLRRLDERGVSAVQEDHLVMLQCLELSEAALVASALRLTGQSTQLLQRMEDGMLALIGGGADRYVWTNLTAIERHQAGAARRG